MDWIRIERSASALQIETTLHVINPVAIRLERGTIAKFGWPDVGIVGVHNLPANASFTDTALQVRNVCRLLQSFAAFVAALGKEILGRLYLPASTFSSLAAKEGRSLNPPRVRTDPNASPAPQHRMGGWLGCKARNRQGRDPRAVRKVPSLSAIYRAVVRSHTTHGTNSNATRHGHSPSRQRRATCASAIEKRRPAVSERHQPVRPNKRPMYQFARPQVTA